VKLKGKTGLVTGAGRGIGRAIALALAREGAEVAVLDIVRESAEAVRREVEALGVKGLALAVDLTKRAEVERAVEEVVAQWGQLDVVVNNAGWDRMQPFLDSDDLWLAKKLAAQTAFMEARPDTQICQTEEIWVRNGRRVNPKLRHRKPSGDIFRASLKLCLVSPSAVMMTRELFERVGGFDESLPVCEDFDLWLRIAIDTPIYLIPAPLVVKRGGHEDQLSRSTWGLDRFRVRAIKKLLDAGLKDERRKWAIEELAHRVAILARGARRRGREREALDYNGLLAEFTGEIDDGKSAGSRLREREGIPQTDAGAVAWAE